MKRDLWQAAHSCTACNSLMRKKEFVVEGAKVRGWECTKCREAVLHPEDTQRVLLLNKLKRGLPVKIGELGKSLVVRIPKEVAQLYRLSKGEHLTIKAESDKKIGLETAA